jgi:hypothetical protein
MSKQENFPQSQKENQMKTKIRQAAAILAATTLMAASAPAWAATNQATDPGGGGVSLTSSGLVTVNSSGSALQLVKQVYDSSGNCLASMPADATCNSSATSVTVPTGIGLKFLIFVKNTTDVALTDVRFEDILDTTTTGFTYTASSIKRTANDSTAPADTATAAQIYTAANTGTPQTDALDPLVDYASYTSGTGTLTIGAVTGQVNMSLGFPAHKSFGIIFSVTKK